VIARRALALVVLAACTSPPPPAPPLPTPPDVIALSPWMAALVTVRAAIDAGRFDEADHVLAEFAAAHPQSPEAVESALWRAVLRSDPDNRDGSTKSALEALDAYLAGGAWSPRYVEARALRRLIVANDSLRAALASTRVAGEARERTKDEEIQHLRDELAKVQVELDRIKRRLTEKKP
jgi:hypothetical protein